jgi:hypothetical protein
MNEPRSTLLLKNAKNSLVGPEAFVQIFSALPPGKKSLLPLVDKPTVFSFEIASYQQQVSFLINLPAEYDHYVRSQVIAAYPEINIITPSLAHQHLSFLHPQPSTAAIIQLSHGSFYSLKTFKDFPDLDPLSSLLGVMSKLAPNQGAVVQILVASVSDSWKNAGHKLAAGRVDSEGKVIQNPYKELIETKLALICHRFAVKIAATAPTKVEAEAVLSHLAGTFGTYAHPKSNSFSMTRPLLGSAKLVQSIHERNFR